MKKYLLLMIVVLTTSCRTYYSEQSNVLDFRKYTESGFVINPTSSGMDFEPISMISVSFYSGEKLKGVFKNENGIINIYDKSVQTKFYCATPDRMLEKIVSECKKMGANGIINFNMKPIPEAKYQSWEVSGVAVKLK